MRKLLALWVFAFLASIPQFSAAQSSMPQSSADRLDLYFSDWHNAAPHTVRGALEMRDIFTRGNPQAPSQKGAVLRFINSYSYATLAAGASTKPSRLEDQQEIYFVYSGRGVATASAHSDELSPNIAILVPANLEFTLKNTGDRPLNMYVINEPVPAGFRPNSSILVKDENKTPISSSDGHWAHIVKTLFVTEDGLGTLQSVLTVTIDPLTMGKPHLVDHDDIEEVWSALDGTSLAFVGNQLRKQAPGMAFYHIPDNKTPHTNINQNEDSQVRFLYFARYHPHETRK
jgi:mannose-6-phosphate isomerase-like protein (cupin superfamily)